MAFTYKLSGFDKVARDLRWRSKRKGRRRSTFKIGYTAPYAIHVHENLQAHHNVGQAKFLEEPMRRLQSELVRIVADTLRQPDGTMEQALINAGNFLLAASQPLVPVDTGYLKSSGFVELLGM